jgi:hypothetical protein
VDPQEEWYGRVTTKVVAWASRVASQDATVNEVVQEMRCWAGKSPDRVWTLAVMSVGCVKAMMQDAVSLSSLLLAQEGSWVLDALQGRCSREPDVICAMQTAIAMLNRDVDMANDLLVAHERVGGPAALFGVARVATGVVASMMDPAMWVVTKTEDMDD